MTQCEPEDVEIVLNYLIDTKCHVTLQVILKYKGCFLSNGRFLIKKTNVKLKNNFIYRFYRLFPIFLLFSLAYSSTYHVFKLSFECLLHKFLPPALLAIFIQSLSPHHRY